METSAPRSHFSSIYHRDVSRWGGKTYRVPELENHTLTIEKASTSNSTIRRCVQTMNTGCSPIQTQGSTYQSAYCSNIPVTRGEKTFFNFQKPNVKPPPDAPDPSILRPSTEHASRYRPPNPEPFISEQTIQRCQTATVRTRGSFKDELNPKWNSSYREQYCQKPTANASYSESISFLGKGLR